MPAANIPILNNMVKSLRQRLQSTSLEQIDTALAGLNTALASPQISQLERLILTGRRRELNAARWLVKRILATSQPQIEPLVQPPNRNLQSALKSGELITTTTGAITLKALQAGIFDPEVLNVKTHTF